MNESTLDLFCNRDDDEQYWKELEERAAELEVTLDYYLAEFCA
jgi:hypothetical protein